MFFVFDWSWNFFQVVFEEKEVMDFPHDGGYTAKQEIFVVMKNTDREGSRQFFGINTVDDQVTILYWDI